MLTLKQALFKAIELAPVQSQLMEDKLVRLVSGLVSCPCKRLRLDDILYIEPEDEDEVERVIEHGLENSELCGKNEITVKYNRESLSELQAEYIAKKPASYLEELETKNSTADNTPGVKSPMKESTIEEKAIDALKDTIMAPRVDPPQEFFNLYASEKVVRIEFVLFLLVLLLVKTVTAIFSK